MGRVASSRRGLRRFLLSAALIGLAAGGAWFGAHYAATEVETQSRQRITTALGDSDADWAKVSADGLRVTLAGTAPNEVARIRAVAKAAGIAGPANVIDAITVASAPAATLAETRLDLLRSPDGVSAVGTIPDSADRAALLDQIARASGAPVKDLLQAVSGTAPAGWDAALNYGVSALASSPHTRVSITPGHVLVDAIADGDAQKANITAALNRDRPAEVTLDAQINTPRPVISPFTLRASRASGATRIEVCAAEDSTIRDRILRAAGLPSAQCRLGLGMPGPDWPGVAEAALAALAALPNGTLALVDRQVTLSAPATVPAEVFDAAAARLRAGLPADYRLDAYRDAAPNTTAAPAGFTVSLHNGQATLTGGTEDASMRAALAGLASARLGKVADRMTVDAAAPEGWTQRQLAMIEAMSGLSQGIAELSPSLIRLTGVSGQRDAGELAVARLSHRLGAGAKYDIRIDYDARLDPEAHLPTGADCTDRLNAIMAAAEIGFAASSADIAGDAEPTLAKLAGALADCGDWKIEIGGHTDSQGAADFNLKLSQARAQSVLDALAKAGAPVAHLTARGYGSQHPQATNDTPEGREANRRIEFTLTDAAPVPRAPEPGPSLRGETVDGVSAPPEPRRAGAAMPELPKVGTPPTGNPAEDAARIFTPQPAKPTEPAPPSADIEAKARAAIPASGDPQDATAMPAASDSAPLAPDAQSVSAAPPPQRPEAALSTGQAAPPALNGDAAPNTPKLGTGIAGSVPPLLLDQLEAEPSASPEN